jgi:hypothetical protein
MKFEIESIKECSLGDTLSSIGAENSKRSYLTLISDRSDIYFRSTGGIVIPPSPV